MRPVDFIKFTILLKVYKFIKVISNKLTNLTGLLPQPAVTLFYSHDPFSSWPLAPMILPTEASPSGLGWHRSGPNVASRIINILSLPCYNKTSSLAPPPPSPLLWFRGSYPGWKARVECRLHLKRELKSCCLDTLSTMETECSAGVKHYEFCKCKWVSVKDEGPMKVKPTCCTNTIEMYYY